MSVSATLFTPTFLADLKSRVSVSHIVGRTVKLRPDGKEFREASTTNR